MKNLKNIPLPFLLIIPLLVPFALIFLWNSSKLSSWKNAAQEIEEILGSVREQKRKNTADKSIARKYRDSDLRFLESHLETTPLRQKEKNRLEKHLKTYTFISNASMQQRLNKLKTQNKILFNEKSKTTYRLFQEVHHALSSPVEIDTHDLHAILGLLEAENSSFNRPQLLITDFSLQKKNSPQSQEFFELNLKILQREYP